MKFGYIRVSRGSQNYERQRDAITGRGVDERCIYEEKHTGMTMKRPEFEKLLETLRPDDELYVDDLARIGRTRDEIFEHFEFFINNNIKVVCISQPWFSLEARDPMGTFVTRLIVEVNQLQRDYQAELTRKGLEAAAARGRKAGRPRGMSSGVGEKIMMVQGLVDSGVYSLTKACAKVGISRSTYWKYRKNKTNTIE